jgi:hypothetical protein
MLEQITDRMSTDFVAKIKELAKEEKRLFALAEEQQEKTIEYLDEKLKLESELRELNSEIFYETLRNNKTQ